MKKPDKKYPLSVIGDLLASTPQSEIVFVPDKIYTNNRGVYAELPIFSQTNANIEYIRKEALIEWLENKIKIPDVSFINGLTYLAYKDVIEHLNEM